jgi:ferredoxin, 2Fe-2S
MPKITFIPHPSHPDADRVVDAAVGQSVMHAAVQNGINGIQALCGGSCACATCHVYVDQAWIDRTGMASEMEKSMLELAIEVGPNSRLSCQIQVIPELDGLLVRMPISQEQ